MRRHCAACDTVTVSVRLSNTLKRGKVSCIACVESCCCTSLLKTHESRLMACQLIIPDRSVHPKTRNKSDTKRKEQPAEIPKLIARVRLHVSLPKKRAKKGHRFWAAELWANFAVDWAFGLAVLDTVCGDYWLMRSQRSIRVTYTSDGCSINIK